MLDLRAPIGWLFVLIAALVLARGYLNPHLTPLGSISINLNITWGAVMGMFGLLMVLLASYPQAQPGKDDSPDDRAAG